MKTIKNVSISRSGLKTDTFNVNTKTIALAIHNENIDELNKIKKAYEEKLKEQGLNLKFQKNIYYKKPFWKFWGISDCTIIIYDIIDE